MPDLIEFDMPHVRHFVGGNDRVYDRGNTLNGCCSVALENSPQLPARKGPSSGHATMFCQKATSRSLHLI
jgi:hypothetical protein